MGRACPDKVAQDGMGCVCVCWGGGWEGWTLKPPGLWFLPGNVISARAGEAVKTGWRPQDLVVYLC